VATLDPAALHLQAEHALLGVGEHEVDLPELSAVGGVAGDPARGVEDVPVVGEIGFEAIEDLAPEPVSTSASSSVRGYMVATVAVFYRKRSHLGNTCSPHALWSQACPR